MPPILVNVIQGFSARIRPVRSTIGHLAKTVLEPYDDQVVINIENSSDRHCIRRSLNFLNREPSHVVLIGKSLGGVRRTWWLVKNHVEELERHLSVSVIFVDAHGWQVNDGVIGSYGKNRGFPYCEELERFHVVNFYQHNKWPCGAVFEGHDFNRELGVGADHWNCEDVESPESEPVQEEIQRAVELRRS